MKISTEVERTVIGPCGHYPRGWLIDHRTGERRPLGHDEIRAMEERDERVAFHLAAPKEA